MPRRATAPLVALALVITVSLGACAADDEPTPTKPSPTEPTSTSATPSAEAESSSPSETPDEAGAAVTVTRQGGEFDPNGERLDLDVGQTLAVTITADVAGEPARAQHSGADDRLRRGHV